MAWVSPRVYAILSSSEEGKDIIEQLPDMTQDECSQALDEFFGKGGKGYKSNAEYSQAKFDDEAEEERYKSMGDEEVADEDADKEEEEWKTTKMASGTIHELGDKRVIEEENEKGDTQYRINGTNGQVFSSLEEAKNAVSGKEKVKMSNQSTRNKLTGGYTRLGNIQSKFDMNSTVESAKDAYSKMSELKSEFEQMEIADSQDFDKEDKEKLVKQIDDSMKRLSKDWPEVLEEDVKEFANYEEDDIPGATRYRKTTEDNNNIIILKMKENGKYRAFMDGASVGNGDFASFEEAEKAVNKEKQKEVFEEGEEVKINYGYDSPTKAKILRKMPQKELDDLYYSLNPKAPGGYYEVEEEGFMGNKNKRVVWARRIDRKK